MNIESFLDYNQILKVIFKITGEKVNYNFICNTKDKRLSNSIIENLKSISSLEDTENPDICRLSINDTIFINLNKHTGEIESVNKLTSFETRLLAQGKTNSIPFSREQENNFSPRTDLHTHFAGALTPDTLIDVGKKHDIDYPTSLLNKIGINISRYTTFDKVINQKTGETQNFVKFNDLDKKDINLLKENLMISPITQETFNKMEEIYALRGPFTKNSELFPDYLRALAEDYKRTGIDYAELSFSAFLTNPNYMQMLEDNLPKIEEETGVKLKFLAGLWRHSDQEWNLYDPDRLMRIAKSPYIVGVDVMGHETNSTDTFMEELQTLARYSMREDPNFVIRVHAGENNIYKDNVKRVLEIIYNEHKSVEEETGLKQPMPQIRIGHGLYGLREEKTEEDKKYNEEIISLLKEMNAIIEFNMSSNLALNNINSISDIPIKKYIDSGIDVVLGTDGHGMYSTFGEQETLLATAAGLQSADFEKVKATEQRVLKKAIDREKTHSKISNVPELYSNIQYSTPDGQPRYTKEVSERYANQKIIVAKQLDDTLSQFGIITDEETIARDTEGKIPIVITGASDRNWPNILPKDQKYIELTMQVLANAVNPETAYIVTGGTNSGVERRMHESVHRRNEKENNPLVLLGTLTMEATKEGSTGVEPNTITHAMILEIDGRKANNWVDLPDTQLEYARERNGHMIAIGGGGTVNDMIQRGHNLGVDMHLMNGPKGASTNKSKHLAGNDYSFKTIPELLQRLYQRDPNLFYKDFSLENIDTYIQKAQQELGQQEFPDNPANFGLGAIEQIDKTVSYQDRVTGKEKLQQELQQAKDKSEVTHNDIGI